MNTPGAWRAYAFASAGFTLLTLALTYPQVLALSSHVGTHSDALFSIWRLAWIAHQLPRDPLHLFDANIFHPEPNTLAYSDAILFQGLLAAPLFWLGFEPVVVYNLLVLLSFVAAAVAMYAWLSVRGMGAAPAALGALIFGFQQYRFAHYPHLELLWTCWIPLAFLALEKIFDRPRLHYGLLLGLVVTFQFWSSLYYGLFLVSALVLLTAVLLLARNPRQWLDLLWCGVSAAALAAVLCLPYAIPYLETADVRGQRMGEAAAWSASPENYVSTTGESLLFQHSSQFLTPLEGVLFPGFLTLALAILGVARARDFRTFAYFLLAVAAFDLSLGVYGVSFEPLTRVVPIYDSVRVPARVFVILSAALALLAASGAAALLRSRTGRGRAATAAILFTVTLLELSSVPLPLGAVPERPAHIYKWLRDQPRGATVEWPLPRPTSLGVTRVPEYMYFSTEHWQPLAVGYSGLHPRSYFRLIEGMSTFPSPRSLAYLQRLGVRYLIVHSGTDLQQHLDLANALGDRPEIDLLRVDRTAREEIAVYLVHPPQLADQPAP